MISNNNGKLWLKLGIFNALIITKNKVFVLKEGANMNDFAREKGKVARFFLEYFPSLHGFLAAVIEFANVAFDQLLNLGGIDVAFFTMTNLKKKNHGFQICLHMHSVIYDPISAHFFPWRYCQNLAMEYESIQLA